MKIPTNAFLNKEPQICIPLHYTPMYEFTKDYHDEELVLDFKAGTKVLIECTPFTPYQACLYIRYGKNLQDVRTISITAEVSTRLVKAAKFIGFGILPFNLPRWFKPFAKKWCF